jgi:hypothetical protein
LIAPPSGLSAGLTIAASTEIKTGAIAGQPPQIIAAAVNICCAVDA